MKLRRSGSYLVVLLFLSFSLFNTNVVALQGSTPGEGKFKRDSQSKKAARSKDKTVASQSSSDSATTTATVKDEDKDDPTLKGLTWRLVGPFRGGRVLAVSGVVGDPFTYYFGGVAGGIWKTTDGGLNWAPISDKHKISSVGAIAVSESDPNVIYAGSGEAAYRGNIVGGEGVYKSTDAGKSWKLAGLPDSEHIARIVIHPKNPDIVFVAAMGHAYGTNTERGVFRSTDGGKNWEQVLYKDEKTGCVDITFDPTNPSILFAALYQTQRMPWGAISGGPGSGLYRSADGGTSWKHLEDNGLPSGVLGKIGVTVSAANPNRVWAQIEAEKGGLYRSEDGGQKWQLINDNHNFRQRAWYYTYVFADPKNPDGLYSLNTSMWHSTDGGKTFRVVPAPHGDHHGLWIDPNNPKRMINSNDGGANISINGGETWSSQDTQPTAQFYHVITDDRFPYYIYGAQQDNSTVAIASRTDHSGIDRTDWYTVGGCESGYIAPYPKDADIVYSGCYGGHITRFNKRTGESSEVNAWPLNPIGAGAAELKYRYQWTAPIVISPFNRDVVYHGSQKLMKTTDGGRSWTEISPDLTRNDKSKQQSSGGPLTQDNTSVEYYDTIFTIVESPLQKDLIWVGTDDGLIHITQDGGKNWSNITPKGIPDWSRVSLIEASPFDAGTAYAAVERHELDDYAPYIFKTTDFGKSWTRIEGDLPGKAFVHAVREDPKRKGLLFAATELGVFFSPDAGAHWRSLQRNLPASSMRDIVVKNDDLVVATHGRSFWVLDDISPLRQLDSDIPNAEAFLFKPGVAYRFFGGPGRGNVGQNPPNGAIIYYQLKNALKKDEHKSDASDKDPGKTGESKTEESKAAALTSQTPTEPEGAKPSSKAEATQTGPAPATSLKSKADESNLKVEILDKTGKVVRTYPSKQNPTPEGAETPPEEGFGQQRPTALTAEAGLNRFNWDLRYEEVPKVPGYPLWGGGTVGPIALPGSYQVRLTVKGRSYTAPLEIRGDPRSSASAADLQKQFDLVSKIQAKVGETHAAVNQIRDVRRQIDDLTKRLAQTKDPREKTITDAGKRLQEKMKPVEEELIQVKNKSSQDLLSNGIKINNQLAALAGEVESSDGAPTSQSYEVFKMMSDKLDAQLATWRNLVTNDLAAFNQLVRQQDVPAIVVESKSAAGESIGKD